jgi:hypothetical protein
VVWAGTTLNAMVLHALSIARVKGETVSISEIPDRAGIPPASLSGHRENTRRLSGSL